MTYAITFAAARSLGNNRPIWAHSDARNFHVHEISAAWNFREFFPNREYSENNMHAKISCFTVTNCHALLLGCIAIPHYPVFDYLYALTLYSLRIYNRILILSWLTVAIAWYSSSSSGVDLVIKAGVYIRWSWHSLVVDFQVGMMKNIKPSFVGYARCNRFPGN